MKTYNQIKTENQNAYNKIMEDAGVFWAFSTEQFREGVEKIRAAGKLLEGEKITRIPAGGFCPSKNIDKMIKDLAAADKIQRKELKEAKEQKEAAILYELNNHECFYRGNGLEDVADIFKGVYTKQDILKVFNKHNLTERERQEQHIND
jgi:hypothetical protein